MYIKPIKLFWLSNLVFIFIFISLVGFISSEILFL